MKQKKWVPIIIVIVLIVAIILFVQSQKTTLPVYIDEETAETKQPQTVSIPLETYTDNKTGFTIGIPEGWQKVIKDGYATFIHSPSATSIQIQIMDY